jgi:hypothetical protein
MYLGIRRDDSILKANLQLAGVLLSPPYETVIGYAKKTRSRLVFVINFDTEG